MQGLHGQGGHVFLLAAGCDDGHVAEGREVHLLAQLHFGFCKTIGIVPSGELDSRGLGIEGLDNNLAIQVTSPGAARHLGEQLEGALCGARVGDVQAQVCIQHAHQRHAGEVQPLGNHLGAQQNIGSVSAEIGQNIAQCVFARGDIGINALQPGLRETAAQHSLYLLGAVALQRDVCRVAIRAAGRHHLAVAADVAHKPVLRGVESHGQGAVLAVGHIAAFRALQGAGKTAAVQQQNHLFALVQSFINGHAQALGEDAEVALVLGLAAHIQHAGEGQALAVGALIHAQHAVFILLHVVKGFQRWSGRPQHDGSALQLGAQHGEVASMVARAVLLLVGRIVLLVHDDEAEILHRGKDG